MRPVDKLGQLAFAIALAGAAFLLAGGAYLRLMKGEMAGFAAGFFMVGLFLFFAVVELVAWVMAIVALNSRRIKHVSGEWAIRALLSGPLAFGVLLLLANAGSSG